MEIILLERISKLGQMGDIVKVKNGFARNYLLPQKKALRATAENKKKFEESKIKLETQNLELKEEAAKIASKMKDHNITILRQASESSQLYGSVSPRDISSALKNSGYNTAKKQVKLVNTIKQLGIHKAEIVLHPEVSLMLNINVARTKEEAEIQLKDINKNKITSDNQIKELIVENQNDEKVTDNSNEMDESISSEFFEDEVVESAQQKNNDIIEKT